MARARLIGWIQRLTIEPIARAATHVDSLADEPYASIGRADTIQLCAQLEETRRNSRQPGQSGARLPTRLSIVFLTREVRASGWSPQDGDRVTEIADRNGANARAVNLYVTAPQHTAKTNYGNELTQVELVNRDSRQPNEGLV